MKYRLDQLAIEVTRKCNMACAHCLRGDAQNMNICTRYIDKLLEDVDCIGSITFTGGEPSLNVPAIEHTLKRCQELNIHVGNFYVVTNGNGDVLPLAIACLKWYAYCEDDEMCGIALSRDKFHDYCGVENETLLRGLSFFREDKFTNFNNVNIINEGRAMELSGYYKINAEDRHETFSFYDFGDGDVEVESMIYLSANGDVKTDCDLAYNNDEYTIGNIRDDGLNYIIQRQIVEEMDALPI